MNPKKPFQFEKTFEVLSFQIDPLGNLRWAALGDLLQETAWKHADSRGFGQKLFEANLVWVLSRLEIKVHHMPTWGEEIVVKTAGRGIHKLFALREFEVCNSKGEVIAEANSAWLLLNTQTKRPQRPNQVLPSELFDEVDDTHHLPQKIDKTENLEKPIPVVVRASDLDMNNHVNNVSYIRWIEDYAYEFNLSFNYLAINYLSEAKIGETVEIKGNFNLEKITLQGDNPVKQIFTAIIS